MPNLMTRSNVVGARYYVLPAYVSNKLQVAAIFHQVLTLQCDIS